MITSLMKTFIKKNICNCLFPSKVLSVQLWRNRLDIMTRQNLSKGLTHALQRAFNDTNVYVQVRIILHSTLCVRMLLLL